MSFPISSEVLSQIYTRMADDNYGLNTTFNSLATGYSLTQRFAINFTADAVGSSNNFVMADVDPGEWQKASSFRYPLVTLFVDYSENENLQKFHMFSGTIVAGLNIFVEWTQTRIGLEFEKYTNCVEEAVYTVMNRARGAFQGDQDWGRLAVYNGNLQLKKSRLQRGASFWIQALQFRATFELNQFGPS